MYEGLSDFTWHLLILLQRGTRHEFHAVAKVIERLQIEGDDEVGEAAAIGLLETLQNVWANNGEDPEEFFPYLLPESAKFWKEPDDFWHGRKGYPGTVDPREPILSLALIPVVKKIKTMLSRAWGFIEKWNLD